MQARNQSLTSTEETAPLHGILQDWHKIVEPWWKTTLAVLPIFLITRLLMLMLTYLGGVLFNVPNYSSFALTFKSVLYSWYHWDATHYLTIATQSYLDQSDTGFFPLYPAVVHTVSALTHQDALLVGMLIANLAFLATLIVFFRLAEQEFDTETARRSILYLAIFPTSLFFFTAYDVSLFLLFILLCFYTLRQGSWWLAGLFGGLAALTHASGFLLFVVFLYEFLGQNRTELRLTWQAKQITQTLRLLMPMLAALLIPLGLGIYMYTLEKKFHDALAFLHPQGGALLSTPWSAVFTAIHNMLSGGIYTFAATHSLVELLILALFCTALVLCYVGPLQLDKSQWAFPLFGLLVLVYTLFLPNLPAGIYSAYDPLPAIQYNILTVFVVFILLAKIGRRSWFHYSYLLIVLPILTFLVLQLFTDHWSF